MAHETIDTQIFEKLYAAEQVAERIRNLIESFGPVTRSTQFYTRTRIKTYSSIVDKIHKKRQSPKTPLYSFNDITDLVGVRIVTLNDSTLQDAIAVLLKVIERGVSFQQPLFKGNDIWDSLAEAIFYKRNINDPNDVYQLCFDKLIDRLALEKFGEERSAALEYAINNHIKPAEPEKTFYSSAHMLAFGISYFNNKPIVVPVEFQVRTAIEDVWAEIDHKLIYKTEKDYVWSPDLETLRTQLKANSENLKRALQVAPGLIEAFRANSVLYDQAVDEFREPTSEFHSSIVVTLFYSLNHRLLGTLPTTLLVRYDRVILKMQADTKGEQALAALQSSLKIVMQIKDELERIKERQKSALDIALCEQRIILCDFERLRLKALALITYKRIVIKGDILEQFSEDKEDVQKYFEKLYWDFCDLKQNDKLHMKPMCVILYWKHLLVLPDNQKLAMQYLMTAHSEIKYDASLPNWSIYRILIPRKIAKALYEEVLDSLRSVYMRRSPKTGILSSSYDDVREKIIHAARYAGEACFRNRKREIGKTGDLIFGFEEGELIVDSVQIFDLTIVYYDSCGGFLHQDMTSSDRGTSNGEHGPNGYTIDGRQLDHMLGEVAGYLEDESVTINEIARIAVRERIERVREIRHFEKPTNRA